MREVMELFSYYENLKIKIEEEINKRIESLNNICPHCKENEIEVHYKEPYYWLKEDRENNTFTLNVLFFCNSCFQKFEQQKTGE